MKSFFYTLLLVVGTAVTVSAQDPHFSQFYLSPLNLNPTMTGLMNWKTRITANYRNQWGSVTKPYQTYSLSADGGFFREALGGDIVGAGLILNNDIAGDAGFRSTQIAASLAYHKSLNADQSQFLSAGLQAGMVQRDLDFTKLFFDSQYDGDILNPNIPSGETIGRSRFWYFDIGAGLSWTYMPNERTAINFGASVFHINQPSQGFLDGSREQLYRKFVAHASAEFAMGDRLSLLPQAMFMSQGPAKETNVGLHLKIRLGDRYALRDSKNAIYFGTTHRFGDAQIIHLRMDIGPVVFAFSYDYNLSKLNRASKGMGGPEIALMYRFGQIEKVGGIGCPTF